MCYIIRNADKLFDKITHSRCFTRNEINISYYVTLSRKPACYLNPVDFSAEKDDVNVISWTWRLSNLVRRNKPEEAIGLLKKMFMTQQRPNYVTILSVTRAFGALHCEDLIKMVHALLIKMGFESEVVVSTAILGFYSNHNMEAAWKLFGEICNKDVVLWSAMVAACVNKGQYVEAIELLKEMQYFGVKPNHVSVVSILPACAYVGGGLSLVKEIHGFLIRNFFVSFTNVQNSLVDMYAKCENLGASIRVFNGILKKDLISWRTMIRGCIENECARKALSLFSLMQSYCFEPDESIIRDIIVALTQKQETKFGLSVHCYILKKGFSDFSFLGTALLHMYAKLGEVSMASNLFDQLNNKDIFAWSAMILVYAQGGQPYNALSTFKQMQSKNEKPNEFTFVGLLQAYSSMGTEELAGSIHAHLIKMGYSSNKYLKSALIDFYCKYGRMEQGKAVFHDSSTKDLICWSSMIKGYGINGCGDEALETFSNMLDSGLLPNDVVFLSVLSACSHCALEDKGWSLFYSMKEKYNITPKLAHYACMVDLLSYGGNVEEALDFINKMPVEADKRIWGSLLAGCKSARGSIEIAEIAVERLSFLDPQNSSYYKFLLDLYEEEGRYENVEKLKKLLDDKGSIN